MSEPTLALPRLAPERSFPPYSYVPGLFPHPVSDPAGHSHGVRPAAIDPVDPESWPASREYLFGIDLFNHGYYWEAHEVWEGLWHACGRGGLAGDFLKGLIQLTAAGVKVRQRMPRGVASLAQGAADLFQKVRVQEPRFLGLDVGDLHCFAAELEKHPPADHPSSAPVERVLSLVLSPG